MFELHSAAEFGKLPADHQAWAALATIKEEHLSMLSDINNRFKEFSVLDERFHLLIHRASKNRFIADFYDAIAIIFHYHYQWNKTAARERNERAIHEHLDYIAALEARDQERIQAACRIHLRSARQTLLQSIPQSVAESA